MQNNCKINLLLDLCSDRQVTVVDWLDLCQLEVPYQYYTYCYVMLHVGLWMFVVFRFFYRCSVNSTCQCVRALEIRRVWTTLSGEC